jgi:uncharacterized protein YndB with AHSA1/START domain
MVAKGSGALEVTLPSNKEILLKRVFDAPRHLVFETMTKPEYVRRWWGCKDNPMTVCEIDLRVGGRYRYVSRAPDGNEFAFHGVYREIVVPERIVHTEIFEPFPDEETVCTMKLEERGGKTYYSCLVVHTTAEGRDAHITSGMEGGADLALDRLEAIARELLTAGRKASPSPDAAART